MKSNIVLIGMPGVGKSTVGVLLAKRLSKAFFDTDVLIQKRHASSLQNIIDKYGYQALRKFEEKVIRSLAVSDAVIATGGSAVYSKKGMSHLASKGVIVYLKLDKKTLLSRITDFATRGIARPASQSFAAMFKERTALYKIYGDISIDCASLDHGAVVDAIVREAAAMPGVRT